MRTVKTAVSVMISYLVFVPFGLLYREELGGVWGQMGPLYACIACVVCMQSSLGQTMQQGISRFIGVAVGGTLGVLVLALGEPGSVARHSRRCHSLTMEASFFSRSDSGPHRAA